MQAKQAVSANGSRQNMGREPDPQVKPRAERRQFSVEYKRRILAEADGCTQRGELGALLRREGLYSSHLDKWRKQREQGKLTGKGEKRGRKADPQGEEIARLQRENEQMRIRLERAERIIEVQKKLAQLLGMMCAESESSGMPC